MAPEGRMLFVDASRVFVASEPIDTASFAKSVANRIRPLVCSVRQEPFTRRGVGQEGRGNMSRSKERREVALHGIQLSGSSSGFPPRAGSASFLSGGGGHRPCGNLGLVCLVPCWNLRPVFHHFRHHHRT